MGYVYLFCVALMFSFGGTCSRQISPYFGPEFVTLFRFVFGVFFLFLLKLALRQRFRADYRTALAACIGWLLFGAAAKWGAYITENYGLAHGPSYGNIITQPAQTVFLTLASVFLFREKLSFQKLVCIILCMAGTFCISWNGRPLTEFFRNGLLLTLLFVLSGFCAGAHVLAQKMIADRMDIIDSNLTIFAFSSVLAFLPVAPGLAGGALEGIHPGLSCLLGILGFGFITGIGFYLNARAIPLVPFYMVPVIQSSMVIFSILWGMLFFHERITPCIIGGALTFMAALIRLQILNQKK